MYNHFTTFAKFVYYKFFEKIIQVINISIFLFSGYILMFFFCEVYDTGTIMKI